MAYLESVLATLTPDAAITEPGPPSTVEGSLSVVEADDSGREDLASAGMAFMGGCFPFFPPFLALSSSSFASMSLFSFSIRSSSFSLFILQDNYQPLSLVSTKCV